jgi:hypothetical protein
MLSLLLVVVAFLAGALLGPALMLAAVWTAIRVLLLRDEPEPEPERGAIVRAGIRRGWLS